MDAETAVLNSVAVQGVLRLLELSLHLYAYLFPQQATIRNHFKYDFIIVGGGTAGCVLARRLSDNENFNVLLIEAGDNPPLEVMVPGLVPFTRSSKFDWNYTTVNDNHSFQCYKNDIFPTIRGRGIGGTSSVNFLMYFRGHPHDYNQWADKVKSPIWNYNNVLPYFKKVERVEDEELLNSNYRTVLGTKGNVGLNRFPDDGIVKYINALNEIGYESDLDPNGLGISFPLYNLAQGTRQSSCYCYVSPVQNRKNLHVLRNTKVAKVVFKNKTAIGVEVIKENNDKMVIHANLEVILSAGTYNSPQILMLSGIGPRKHLTSHNIKTLMDLPVGYNLHHHVGVSMVHQTEKIRSPSPPNNFSEPLLKVVNGFISLNEFQSYPDVQYILASSKVAEGLLNYFAFVFPRDDDIAERIYEANKEREVLHTFILHTRPLSRGRITLRSADPSDQPEINFRAFSNKKDLDDVIRYIKDYVRIENSTYFKNVNAKRVDLAGDRCRSFPRDSYDYWRCYTLCSMILSEDYSGTCAMGSVVDSHLRVLGVRGLRVVDASVFPNIPSSLTNGPTMMVAEKAADLIKQDY